MTIDKNYYPGWVRKAITFTIDDGNLKLDRKFINKVRPYGIKGTFNLCAPDLINYTPAYYLELYRGFGISNHCKLHPFAMADGNEYNVSLETFDAERSDPNKIYPISDGLYHYHTNAGWRKIADTEAYCRLVDECKTELEAVFGEGCISTYVWPYYEQNNSAVQDYVMNKCGYTAVRKTGATENKTAFAVPADRMRWSYNANHKNLLSCAEDFESFLDDGELKFFSFGVHSHDFERDNCWDVLDTFAAKYGNRPETYWYATVEDIFRYSDAIESLVIKEDVIENHSDIDIYVKIDGARLIIPAKTDYKLS